MPATVRAFSFQGLMGAAMLTWQNSHPASICVGRLFEGVPYCVTMMFSGALMVLLLMRLQFDLAIDTIIVGKLAAAIEKHVTQR